MQYADSILLCVFSGTEKGCKAGGGRQKWKGVGKEVWQEGGGLWVRRAEEEQRKVAGGGREGMGRQEDAG